MKLSIVVPTKDRYPNLRVLRDQVCSLLIDGDTELVVFDTSNRINDDLVRSLRDTPNLKYIYSSENLSISNTISQALTFAEGEFVTVIGDDDFVHPLVNRYLEAASKYNVDVIIHAPAQYWWPDIVFAKVYSNLRPASLVMNNAYTGKIRELSSLRERKIFQDSGSIYIGKLPRLYHGFVRKGVLQELIESFEDLVVGSSPDISLALQLSYIRDKYVHIDFPLTVYGACYNSGGGMTARKAHHGELEKMSFLPSNIITNWDENLPKIWSERIIYAQTAYEVSTRIGKSCGTNYFRTYTGLLIHEYKLKNIYLPFILNKEGAFNTITILFKAFLKRLWSHISSLFSKRKTQTFQNVQPENINEYLIDVRD